MVQFVYGKCCFHLPAEVSHKVLENFTDMDTDGTLYIGLMSPSFAREKYEHHFVLYVHTGYSLFLFFFQFFSCLFCLVLVLEFIELLIYFYSLWWI